MKIRKFSQLGKRGNNEDNLGVTGGLVTVCDGMGGHDFGERASQYIVENMTQLFDKPMELNKMEIQQKLNDVQLGLNALLEKEPELDKMGTTFTGVFITPDVWYAAHIGDSRIYLFRPSEQKLWHTWDHSLVGELMRTHEITIEAGRFHPMSNRISKAIIAHQDGKPASASIVKIDELKAGDVLLLCSDGVVESWGDYELVQLFADRSLDFDQKCEKLRKQCDEHSKDNNTAVIIEVEDKDEFKYGTNTELEWTSFAEVEDDYNKYLKDNGQEGDQKHIFTKDDELKEAPTKISMPTEKKSNSKMIAVIAVVVFVICIVGGILLFGGGGKEAPKTDDKSESKPDNIEVLNNNINQQKPDINVNEKLDKQNEVKPDENKADEIKSDESKAEDINSDEGGKPADDNNLETEEK